MLVALVVTIIVLLILAGITLNLVIGQNGVIEKAKLSREKTMIAQYKEKIEMIKMETSVEYQGNETLENLNNAFNADNQKYWVNKAEIENEIIKLTTNDGYLFWITKSSTEYKGTGDVENNSISAESVGYTPDNSLNWTGVTNVKQALDYLYNN